MKQKIILGCLGFILNLFIIVLYPTYVFSNNISNKLIKEATIRIIFLIKNKPSVYQNYILVLLEKWKINIKNKDKIYILNTIQHFIGGFIGCENINGDRLDDYFECEYIDFLTCKQLGGKYNKCASACRHSDTSLCLLNCKEVCIF